MDNAKTLLFTLLFVVLHISCKAQQTDNFTGTLKINDTIELGDTPQTVITKFGQPNNTENWYGEVSGNNYISYHYNNGAVFDFVDNQLKSFMFTSSTYKIKLGSFELKVENHINTLASAFPNTYQNRVPDGTDIGLGTGDYQYLNIKTNSNGTITEIELRFIP